MPCPYHNYSYIPIPLPYHNYSYKTLPLIITISTKTPTQYVLGGQFVQVPLALGGPHEHAVRGHEVARHPTLARRRRDGAEH